MKRKNAKTPINAPMMTTVRRIRVTF